MPPPTPEQDQLQGPVPLTLLTVPALQRLVLGDVVNVVPLAEPHSPLIATAFHFPVPQVKAPQVSAWTIGARPSVKKRADNKYFIGRPPAIVILFLGELERTQPVLFLFFPLRPRALLGRCPGQYFLLYLYFLLDHYLLRLQMHKLRLL